MALFVDKACLDIAWHRIDRRQIDYSKLVAFIELAESDRFEEVYAFDATENGEWTACHKALSHAGIRVKVYRTALERIVDEEGRAVLDQSTGRPRLRRIQKGVDVGLATRMLESHRLHRWSHLVLAATDGDFAEPVQRLVEDHGVRFTLLGVSERVSFALKPYMSGCYELQAIANDIVREKQSGLRIA